MPRPAAHNDRRAVVQPCRRGYFGGCGAAAGRGKERRSEPQPQRRPSTSLLAAAVTRPQRCHTNTTNTRHSRTRTHKRALACSLSPMLPARPRAPQCETIRRRREKTNKKQEERNRSRVQPVSAASEDCRRKRPCDWSESLREPHWLRRSSHRVASARISDALAVSQSTAAPQQLSTAQPHPHSSAHSHSHLQSFFPA